MKKIILALAALTVTRQITPLFRRYDDERPGLVERVVTKPARIVDKDYDEEFEGRKDPRDRRRYRRYSRSSSPRRSESELQRVEADVEEYI